MVSELVSQMPVLSGCRILTLLYCLWFYTDFSETIPLIAYPPLESLLALQQLGMICVHITHNF